jgi:asparagine synthase (glutamine-hydrolysing)
MCGIAGIAHSEGGRTDQHLVRRMCSLIAHRGPDGEGFYFDDWVGLGMRRLAIIDVQTGQQPIANETQSVWVVFNGELYNYQELRRDLERRHHHFATSSDTECLVHLYEDFGDEAVSRLRGMFAFAIWDTKQRRLLLARDRLGIKPLYYTQQAGRLAFASEMKCLLAVDGVERQMNLAAFSRFFSLGYVPGPDTIYDSIHELPPAHVAVWHAGQLEQRRYWEITPEPDDHKSEEFYAEGLLHHLREAVGVHLMSEVPLGAFLSGGIDSSAIVALMAQASRHKVKTFTIGFDSGQAGVDERPFARMIAEKFSTDHSECLLSPKVADVLPDLVQAFDEPFADSSMIPNYFVCQAARDWVTVALSGLGGDELFAGYERYRGALLAEHYRRVPRMIRHRLLDPAIAAVPVSGIWRDRLKRFVQGAELDLAERYQRYVTAYDDAEMADLFSGDLLAELRERGISHPPLVMNGSVDAYVPLDRMLFTDFHTYLPDDELRKIDRLSMRHSLEVRVPFLDHKLVEFVATIPARYKLRIWQKKRVLIRALSGTLPKEILTRRKQGFSIPLDTWLRTTLREFVHTHLAESALRRVGLFDPKGVAKILREHEQGVTNHETRIWTLLIFMLWHDLYIGR